MNRRNDIFYKGAIYDLIRITKEEKEYLIKNKYLKMRGGKYPDLIVIRKRKKNKKYFVPKIYAKYLDKSGASSDL